MGKSLDEIAQELKNCEQKVQLIYAFNGTGKTRLSRKFKDLIAVSNPENIAETENEILTRKKILYYNAFTEDLFYWDNDLQNDSVPVLKIHPNSFTKWILEEQGQDRNIYDYFQSYTNKNITPKFNSDFSEVSFSFSSGDTNSQNNIKISKGEERNFVWSVFYTLIQTVLDDLKEQKESSEFSELEYIFIDDPVSSLDDNHLIQLAIELSILIKNNVTNDSKVKFIITTHSPIFFNVLFNELDRDDKNYEYKGKNCCCRILRLLESGLYNLENSNDSPFSYHLYLRNKIHIAIKDNKIERYHFHFLRHLLEKLSTFLGYKKWEMLLPPNSDFEKRILNLSSHSKHSSEEISIVDQHDKDTLKKLMQYIDNEFKFYLEEVAENAEQ